MRTLWIKFKDILGSILTPAQYEYFRQMWRRFRRRRFTAAGQAWVRGCISRGELCAQFLEEQDTGSIHGRVFRTQSPIPARIQKDTVYQFANNIRQNRLSVICCADGASARYVFELRLQGSFDLMESGYEIRGFDFGRATYALLPHPAEDKYMEEIGLPIKYAFSLLRVTDGMLTRTWALRREDGVLEERP